MDTVEGLRVALKIPHQRPVDQTVLEDFRREIRLVSKLKHPNILQLKTADVIDGHLVVAYPLAERTLAERLQSRLAVATATDFSRQLLSAVACAHRHHVVHCDVKPDNLLLFRDGTLMLSDFGIAKVALRTVRASGSGTLGFCPPEQAMGKPSFRSDVFASGLVIYRMFSGQLPEWPFAWPPPGYRQIRRRAPVPLIDLIRRSIELDPRKRFANADAMLASFEKVASHTSPRRSRKSRSTKKTASTHDWKTVQFRQFKRLIGKSLETRFRCSSCQGPVSEPMTTCPWCGTDRHVHRDDTKFPIVCPRCSRGLKLDWPNCPWCYGPGFEVETTRQFTDVRYSAQCNSANCPRGQLMPFMRYCPWCRQKVRRKWRIKKSTGKCRSCGWGVVPEFWSYCPWCGKSLSRI